MQDINVISHSMLVDRDEQGNAFTTSLVIADGTGNEHRAVLQLVKNNIKDFEEFGRVAFEMQPFKTAGGVQERKVAQRRSYPTSGVSCSSSEHHWIASRRNGLQSRRCCIKRCPQQQPGAPDKEFKFSKSQRIFYHD